MGFFGLLGSKAPADSEVAAAIIEELLQRLASHLCAADKVVRYRAGQLMQLMLARLPDSLLLEESVVDGLRNSLTERLQDKLPAVRTEAVRAICHLQKADEEVGATPKPVGQGAPVDLQIHQHTHAAQCTRAIYPGNNYVSSDCAVFVNSSAPLAFNGEVLEVVQCKQCQCVASQLRFCM
jgi:hypothetical protein